ncbi:MAG: protein kinase [Longimicrobiales bacterium]|nr:protein kinase [Longimicrobiales bacterium]
MPEPRDPPARLAAALADRYRIERELGAGGMATVYLADDLKHDRKVAVKVLRPELAAMVGAERFLAEIRTTANLQHPHILPLFDSGEADGFLYYVMPFISGETLRDRLTREKQLPVEEAVRVARGVASALDYAHRQGVIHRDIKPANILLHDGEPLVADFGIALAVQEAGGGRLTETGLSLGTPYYMSPEQAAGDRDPDARSDVYSVGCVTYEMLVGDPPFTGSTAQSVLAKILTGEAPRVTESRKVVPRNVAAAVACATQRLPADRFPTAGAFAVALQDEGYRFGGEGGTADGPHAALHGAGRGWKVASGALAGLSVVLVGVLAARPGGDPAGVAASPLALQVILPDSQRVMPVSEGVTLGLSADGSTLVYQGPGPNAGSLLWVKRRGELDANPIRGTTDPLVFAVSPDGSEVAYILQSGPVLEVVPTAGGTPRSLADSALAVGLEWGEDGYVYFQNFRAGLSRVPAEGGMVETLGDRGDRDQGEGDHAWPDRIPGSRNLLFTLWGNTPDTDSIAVLDLETFEVRPLTVGVNARFVSPGHLLVATNDGNLSVAPFDPAAGVITGPFLTVAGDVRAVQTGGRDFAVSASGTLVFLRGNGSQGTPAWVDREGGATPIHPEWTGTFNAVALSPDGTRVAATVAGVGRSDVWVSRVDGLLSPPQRITFQEGNVIRPFWLPQGDSVAYIANRPGQPESELLARRWDGTGGARTLLSVDQLGTGRVLQEADVSVDGEWIVYRVGGGVGTRDIYAFQIGVDTVGRPLIAEGFNEHSPAISPDGRFLAYGSNESGRDEVYVRTFPDVSGGKWLVSTRGGREPVWSADGRTLYFRDFRGDLTAVGWNPAGSGGVLSREVLFPSADFLSDPVHAVYAAHPDGDRFLMVSYLNSGAATLMWIENFTAGLTSSTPSR